MKLIVKLSNLLHDALNRPATFAKKYNAQVIQEEITEGKEKTYAVKLDEEHDAILTFECYKLMAVSLLNKGHTEIVVNCYQSPMDLTEAILKSSHHLNRQN